MRVSGWTVVAASVLTVAVVTGFIVGRDMWEARQRQRQAELAQRQAPVAEIAPAPLPTGIPLLGRDQHDADGYPTRYVDRAALRSLLWHKRYSDLTRYFEQFQSEFEADPRKEYWPADAGDAFSSAEPDLRLALDAWVATTPNSFAPHLARGNYWLNVAYARRGTEFAGNTAREYFVAMIEALTHSLADLDRAIELRPRLVAAMRSKIFALRASSENAEQVRQTINQAIAVCSSCFQVRVIYMAALTPRWGGSYEEMTEFAREGIDPSNRRMRLLPGYIDVDEAQLLLIAKKPKEALAAIERACALGEYWDFLHTRADVKDHLKDLAGATTDLDRALALRPGHPILLLERAYIHHRARRWEAAGRDLVAGVRMDPTNPQARRILDTIVKGLIHEGWVHHKAGRREDALRVYDLAAELAPMNHEVQSRREFIVMGKAESGGDNIAVLEERMRKSPDDVRVLHQLTTALARQGQFPRKAEMLTAYLARHPNDASAYLWRGGAYFRMGKLKEAHADAQKACELGNSEGCARAKQVEAMAKR